MPEIIFCKQRCLLSSDGTADGTMPVDDQVISGVYVRNIVVNGDNIYISGDSPNYGIELYEGHIDEATRKLTVFNTAKEALNNQYYLSMQL